MDDTVHSYEVIAGANMQHIAFAQPDYGYFLNLCVEKKGIALWYLLGHKTTCFGIFYVCTMYVVCLLKNVNIFQSHRYAIDI